MTYNAWIEAKLQVENPQKMCSQWTDEMLKEFPELTRVRGEVFLSSGHLRNHWWLISPDGEIVDPTELQFRPDQVITYLPRDESQPEPTGKCYNCGEYCYDGEAVCSSSCEDSYMRYINFELRRAL